MRGLRGEKSRSKDKVNLMGFILKIHNTEKGNVVAVCDADILGKKFEEDELVLDVSEKFFGGNKADIKTIRNALRNVYTANIVGNAVVSELLKLNIISKDGIGEINGIKHAHIFKL